MCLALRIILLRTAVPNLTYQHFSNKIHFTYLLTHSTVQSSSWAANWFAAGQEIPRISRNPKVHYRTHKRPPPVSILDQPNPVQIPTSHLPEFHLNIILPSAPGYSVFNNPQLPTILEALPPCAMLCWKGTHLQRKWRYTISKGFCKCCVTY